MDGLSELLRRLGLDLTALANVLGRITNASIVRDGRRVQLAFAPGATTATALHGLGRSYQAALLETADGPLDGFRCVPAGAGSDRVLTVAVATAPLTTVNLSCWVY